MVLDLPPAICFRVTRRCNARCSFCLAPADGILPDAETLLYRLDWLWSRGVKTVQFCGGEPTLHPALPRLLKRLHGRGGKPKLTTNAIAMSEPLLGALRETKTQVKVSLHGDRDFHDTLVGCQAFDSATRNLRRLTTRGIPVSVQTTVVAGGAWVLDWLIEFCLASGVSRLSILPFIPRGRGLDHPEHRLTSLQRRELKSLVTGKRRALNGRLDLRFLDFTAKPLLVVEADGRIVLEGATEAGDEVLGRIVEIR